jgi:hypothetical protein
LHGYLPDARTKSAKNYLSGDQTSAHVQSARAFFLLQPKLTTLSQTHTKYNTPEQQQKGAAASSSEYASSSKNYKGERSKSFSLLLLSLSHSRLLIIKSLPRLKLPGRINK